MKEQYNKGNCKCNSQEGCSCGCDCGCNCGCSNCNCGCESDCRENFYEVADEAWVEVLKEKIKTKILQYKGDHMEKLAEMIAKANGERWKNKISGKMKNEEFKEKLKEFFSACE